MSTTLEMQPIEIFRAGNYGAKGNITAADLERIASSYKPDEHEAPVVIGHPKTNAPAFGWVKSLKAQGAKLLATFNQVQPEFAEMVEKRLFKKRSASFYRDPCTGEITGLRHVGFLGAQPPDIKGLKDVQFDDEGRELTEVDFEESEMADTKQLEDSLYERLKALFTPKPAAEAAAAASFSEADVDKKVEAATKSIREEFNKLVTSFSEREQKLATAETKGRAAAAIAKLKTGGKWVPAFEKMGLVSVFEELATAETTVEFEEGGEKKQKPLLDAFTEFMEGLPKIVPNATFYTGQEIGGGKKTSTPNVNETSTVQADPNSARLSEFAEKIKRDKNVSFEVALKQATEEHPELTKPGGASAGAV